MQDAPYEGTDLLEAFFLEEAWKAPGGRKRVALLSPVEFETYLSEIGYRASDCPELVAFHAELVAMT